MLLLMNMNTKSKQFVFLKEVRESDSTEYKALEEKESI